MNDATKEGVRVFNLFERQRVITCSRSEVEGSRTIGRIRNIPLDFRVFITISRKMCYQYHMFLKTQWKSLKSHLVIKLKFHEFKLVSHIYANFLNVNLTIHVFD